MTTVYPGYEGSGFLCNVNIRLPNYTNVIAQETYLNNIQVYQTQLHGSLRPPQSYL